MKEESKVVKSSITVFSIFALIWVILYLITGNFTLALGFCLGYVINLINFKITIVFVDSVLKTVSQLTLIIVTICFMLKMFLYALGLIIAIKLPQVFNLFTVALGYFVIKLSIFYTNYKIKGGVD